jgi:hypothetical protein
VQQGFTDGGVDVHGDAEVVGADPRRGAPVAYVLLRQLLEAHHDADGHRRQVDEDLQDERGQQEQIGQSGPAQAVGEDTPAPGE